MNHSELMAKRFFTTEQWKISEEGDTAIIAMADAHRIKTDSGVEYMIGDAVTKNAKLVELLDIAKSAGLKGFKVTRVEYKGYVPLEAYKTDEELASALAGTN